MMMTAFIPNAYSFDTEEQAVEAVGVVVAKSVSGDTIRVKMNNPGALLEDQTMTINRCSKDYVCEYLVNPSHKVEYLDEQSFDEYAKTVTLGAGLTVVAVAVSGFVFMTVSIVTGVAAKYGHLNEWIAYIAPGALGAISLGATAIVPGVKYDTANPFHHYGVGDALDTVLEGSKNSDELSRSEFEEFVEDLEEGLRSA